MQSGGCSEEAADDPTTRRNSVARRSRLILPLVGLLSQGTANAQTPLAATRQSAEQGDAAAQYNLGVSYDYGLGVPQDDALALAWYRIAADQGHAAARYSLGVLYANGGGRAAGLHGSGGVVSQSGGPGPYRRAVQPRRVLYANGDGVPEDDTQALAWFR